MAEQRVDGWARFVTLQLISAVSASFLGSSLANAQIVPDGTLGTQAIPFTPGACAGAGGTCGITDGTTRGSNLFHSFQQFSLPNGDFAAFITNPAIQNVIVRVTGIGQPFISNINGTIATTDPTVSNVVPTNFFLLNPNGIVFGANASIFVGGSFLASTAERMLFQDGTVFDTRDQSVAPLLTVSVPTGLQTGQAPGTIESRIQVSGLGFNSLFTDFALVGGNVTLNNSIIVAPDRRLELAGVAGAETLGLTSGNELKLNIPESIARGDVSLIQESGISVEGEIGGSIAIHARNLDVSEGSLIFAGVVSGAGRAGNQAGDITLDTTGALALRQNSVISNSVFENSISEGGNIRIRASSLRATEGSRIETFHVGQGNGGTIQIDAQGAVVFDGFGEFSTLVSTFGNAGQGNSGDIRITAQSLEVTNGASLTTLITARQGNAGSIQVNTRDSITLAGGTTATGGIGSDLGYDAVGRGGDIQLTTSRLRVAGGAQITASTLGTGNGGNVFINAADSAIFDGESVPFPNASGDLITLQSGIRNSVGSSGTGTAGNIQILTGTLQVRNGATLTSGTAGNGNAGNILIEARGDVLLEGEGQSGVASQINTSASFAGVGNAGNIQLNAQSLTLVQGADLSSSVIFDKRGNAGNIIVAVQDGITLDGQGRLQSNGTANISGISNFIGSTAVGNTGTIQLNSQTLSVTNGAFINATISGQGNGGLVEINARDQITMSGTGNNETVSSISTALIGGTGRSGDIQITTGRLSLTDQAIIGSLTAGKGDGGNITILARDAISLNQFSNIRSGGGTDSVGNGGQLYIATQELALDQDSTIAAPHFGQGNGGDIQIDANVVRLNNQAAIGTSTASGQGGNILLNIRDLLLLRNGSFISSSAGVNSPASSGGGDGGNITINAPNGFIVGVKSENSDIRANAFSGSGGRVNITAQGIFGLQFRPRLTQFSDITASSTFGVNGIVTLNTPNVDPSRGLAQLPQNLIDTNRILASSCLVRDVAAGGTFIITGTGGLPVRPGDAVLPVFATGDVRGIGERGRKGDEGMGKTEIQHPGAKVGNVDAIAEAQGIYQLPDGQIILSWECAK